MVVGMQLGRLQRRDGEVVHNVHIWPSYPTFGVTYHSELARESAKLAAWILAISARDRLGLTAGGRSRAALATLAIPPHGRVTSSPSALDATG